MKQRRIKAALCEQASGGFEAAADCHADDGDGAVTHRERDVDGQRVRHACQDVHACSIGSNGTNRRARMARRCKAGTGEAHGERSSDKRQLAGDGSPKRHRAGVTVTVVMQTRVA